MLAKRVIRIKKKKKSKAVKKIVNKNRMKKEMEKK